MFFETQMTSYLEVRQFCPEMVKSLYEQYGGKEEKEGEERKRGKSGSVRSAY